MNQITVTEYLAIRQFNERDMDDVLCHLRTFDNYYRIADTAHKWYVIFNECANERFGRKEMEKAYEYYCSRANEQRNKCERYINWAYEQYSLLPEQIAELRYSRLVDLKMWQHEIWH